MIEGTIVENKPLIKIVVGWQLGVQEVIALVDTGFTGQLKISPSKAIDLGLRVTHTESVSLGDEQVVNMQAALAVVAMEGTTNVVDVLIGHGKPVIGVGLLKRFGYTLTVLFKRNYLVLQR